MALGPVDPCCHSYSGHRFLFQFPQLGKLGRYDRYWQDTDYVLKLFDNTVSGSRKGYREFVRKGVSQGRRPELAGGGLVRSAGGWSAVNTLRQSGFRQKADERILGDGDFVTAVLQQAGERFERRYYFKAEGYDFEAIVKRVAELLGMESNQVVTNSKSNRAVKARSLVCFLGIQRTRDESDRIGTKI